MRKQVVGPLPDRPFGVHFRMAKWQSLLVFVSIPLVLLVTQLLAFQGAALIEGPAEPGDSLTMLQIIAAGLSTIVTAAFATWLVAAFGKVSWRQVFRYRRPFDWRRLGFYLAAAAVLVMLAIVAIFFVAPAQAGWGAPTFTPGALGFVLVALLITPFQAAGEEVAFRGAVAPAAGSWFHSPRAAIVLAMIVSGVIFAIVHGSLEPWFVAYLFILSACTVLMGVVSGGLEAAIAFHVSNNVLIGIMNAIFTGEGATAVDRNDARPSPAATMSS